MRKSQKEEANIPTVGSANGREVRGGHLHIFGATIVYLVLSFLVLVVSLHSSCKPGSESEL